MFLCVAGYEQINLQACRCHVDKRIGNTIVLSD